jgi:hypothetical protein
MHNVFLTFGPLEPTFFTLILKSSNVSEIFPDEVDTFAGLARHRSGSAGHRWDELLPSPSVTVSVHTGGTLPYGCVKVPDTHFHLLSIVLLYLMHFVIKRLVVVCI